MFNTLILEEHTSFKDALELLDKSGTGILPIIDHENKLIGIITDGDIRKAILKGETAVGKVINRTPLTANKAMSSIEVKEVLSKRRLRHMPIVDDDGTYVKMIYLDDFYNPSRNNRVVVMAGGLGSRLGDLTRDKPKPMLPVGGKPVLQRIVETFKEKGFSKFTFCVNYKATIIKDYFQNGDSFEVDINYTEEEDRMGTAGALTLVEKNTLDEPFFVINGDVLTKIDYVDFLDNFSRSGALASMVVKQYEEYIPYACVKFDERTEEMEALVEKPRFEHYINAGIYILSPECLDYIPSNQFYDMPTLFDHLLELKKKVKVYRINNQWIDIGYPKDYTEANSLYADTNNPVE